jgi:DNA-binding beta-propeller fold protein YncE
VTCADLGREWNFFLSERKKAMKRRIFATEQAVLVFCLLVMCCGCGGDGNNNTSRTYTVGGTVTGLNGILVLQNNGGNNRTVTANGLFTFSAALNNGAPYSVTVSSQPLGQTCTVTNGSGIISSADVSDVQVACTDNTYTVGGTVSGLNGTLVLQNNGGDDHTIIADGSFTFGTALTNGTAYSVTVSTQPSGQTCTVTNGSGTISAANVTNVQVACVDSVAPSATITFPPSISTTNGETVSVYGTASDESTITAVRVNGLDVQTNDGYATWEVIIPLAVGLNTLTVETEDAVSNSNAQAAAVEIYRGIYFDSLLFQAIDTVGNRTLVTDNVLDAVIAIDLDTGLRTILSDNSTPDNSNPFANPSGIAVDTANNRALVADPAFGGAVIAVDLDTGARTILSDNSIPDANNPFSVPVEITVDTANNRALVLDTTPFSPNQSIIAVDLTTGARTVLSSNSIPDNSNPFSFPRGIAIDTANNRALVTDTNFFSGNISIIAVDLTTGARTVLSSNSIPDNSNPFNMPWSIAVDAANSRALVLDQVGAVIAVDLTTGARTVLSDNSTPDANNPFGAPWGIVVDAANSRALVTDSADAVVTVSLATGARTVLSSNSTPDANNTFVAPRGIAIDSGYNQGLVTVGGLDAVMALDLDTGARSVLSDNSTPDSNNPFTLPSNIAIDETNNRALVTDRALNAVIAVDLTTGARTVLSDNSIPDANNPFSMTWDIAIDETNNRALVTDQLLNAVIAVDLTTGARTVLSDNSTPDANNPFGAPWGIAIDTVDNRALVTDTNWGSVIAVDLTTGARTMLSDNSTPDASNPFSDPWGIAVDTAYNYAFVTDSGSGSVIAVDLTTGARTMLSDNSTPDTDNPFDTPEAIIIDVPYNRALVLDSGLGAVIAVYLESGERVILSR